MIPGSLHRPDPSPRMLAHMDGTVVLSCATGRRSLELIDQMIMPNLTDLEGGLLAWSMEHPVCMPSRTPPQEAKISADTFRKRIRSSFIVESVESGSTLDYTDTAALEAVDALFADIEQLTIRAVQRRIDELAHRARRGGHRLDFIARHVEDFYALSMLLDASPG